MQLTQTYTQLPEVFYAPVDPTPVDHPTPIVINDALAETLGLDPHWLHSEAGLAVLSGQTTLPHTQPIAMAYAGHQFGHWAGVLGDGRALLLGEQQDPQGQRFDIQLKGAGPTPFSRNGDGRSSIGPVVREYLGCEAMAALGIPTTRALAAIATGESVQRDNQEPGGILCRVAKSHVRIGTFEFIARQNDPESVQALLSYILNRHHPEWVGHDQAALRWFEHVIELTATLVARWMEVGFIHGVMNTDNCSVVGETIDYGPFGMLDAFIPDQVYSSIDQHGRYAYNQQPAIAAWNLARLGECLLPLLANEPEAGIEIATAALNRFPGIFKHHFERGITEKVGLDPTNPQHSEHAMALLDCMAANDADMTLTFRRLGSLDDHPGPKDESLSVLFDDPSHVDQWLQGWRQCLQSTPLDAASRQAAMKQRNPAFILRNHLAQQAVDAAIDRLDFEPMKRLGALLNHPFDDQPEHADWAGPPRADERVLKTFCGT
jgi:uncharacterized protein YdiU (UPF0061 family)